ncbi:soluble inorganic pyrophosphatase 6, chloroplastic-like [Impatiens glandulifera]|uniref:soluble inorganic pyrophosphatase 6, chloroplastic-like n=1 Tax=Impatiens glandulifera TaxID=253017 RepID=UPI001FB0D7E5|nr:soluble inorganic pyrophosphatase 6, chloroplastic-like [Impatiens glandulifera]
MAAAARVLTTAAATGNSALSSSFLFRSPFLRSHGAANLSINNSKKNKYEARRNLLTCRAIYNPEVLQIKEDGQPETLDYRVFFQDQSGKNISPWHDIPLHLGDGVYNFIVEIPKESSAKMEVATDEVFTPIKQDTKKGKLRYYPYNINWNYGLLPQTWEDPSLANHEIEGAFGDNDPGFSNEE